MKNKPTKVKPSFYAYIFYPMKCIAKKYGYNLVLNGSLNRDLDLIAIPWENEVKDCDEMIKHLCEVVGGYLDVYNYVKDGEGKLKLDKEGNAIPVRYTNKPHSRRAYVINFNRTIIKGKSYRDKEWYIDISVIVSNENNNIKN